MVTFKQTLENLKADIQRRCQLEGKILGLYALLCVLTKRGVVSVILYRLSRYCYFNHLKFICKLVTILEQIYVKNEISPVADVGPGVVFADSGGIGLTQVAVVGKNCTFLGANSITLGAMEQFDVNQDHIVIGDHCVIGTRARIMRPVNIAQGTQIKANSVVMFSSDTVGGTLMGIPAKRRGVEDYQQIIQWNPLHGGFIHGKQV